MTWDVADTDVAPVSTANVKISLSVDGGHTYPYVLAARTPNDGSAVRRRCRTSATTHARVKIEAVGNVFFDVSNADFAITWPFTGFFSPIGNPPGVNSAKAGSSVPVKFSLGGDRGLAILADGYPASVQVDCVTGAPLGSPEPTSSADGLTFANGQYSYVWKTVEELGRNVPPAADPARRRHAPHGAVQVQVRRAFDAGGAASRPRPRR